MSRHHATLSAQHRAAGAGHNGAQHAAEIVELDTRKFRVAKQARECEEDGERLEGELETLKNRLAELEGQGVEGDEGARRQREMDDPTM